MPIDKERINIFEVYRIVFYQILLTTLHHNLKITVAHNTPVLSVSILKPKNNQILFKYNFTHTSFHRISHITHHSLLYAYKFVADCADLPSFSEIEVEDLRNKLLRCHEWSRRIFPNTAITNIRVLCRPDISQ